MAEHLMPGETMVMKLHRHWIVPLRSLVTPVVVLGLLVVLLDIVFRHALLPHDVKVVITLVAVALAGLWAIVVWFGWSANSFTLTDHRVILNEGVFSRSSKIIALDRVQDVSTAQSVFGRMLGYGRVEIDAAGASGAEVLDHLPGPNHFRDQVFVFSEKRRGSATQPEAGT